MKITFPVSPPPVLSYSMILVEIATRSDLNSVSKATLPKGRDPPPQYNEHLTPQDLVDGMRMDIMWRPPLPELKAGKADIDCPSEVDYYEVW